VAEKPDEEQEGDKKDAKDKGKKEEKKTNADSGKIVNLMAGTFLTIKNRMGVLGEGAKPGPGCTRPGCT
jgi:hypothetical protein